MNSESIKGLILIISIFGWLAFGIIEIVTQNIFFIVLFAFTYGIFLNPNKNNTKKEGILVYDEATNISNKSLRELREIFEGPKMVKLINESKIGGVKEK